VFALGLPQQGIEKAGVRHSRAALDGRVRALVPYRYGLDPQATERTTREGRDRREGIEPLRILVVDDSAISRKLAEYAFEGKPYDVFFFAEDGRRALQLVSERNPDIVITDWLMPDLSGVDLCRLIRQKLQRKDIYLMLLTSNSGPGRYS